MEEKTRLEKLLFENNISFVQVQKTIGVKQPGTVSKKVHKESEWTCSEMKAIRNTYFPTMSLEYVFEDY